MDIRAEIYKEIADRKGIGYPEDEFVAKRLSEADTQQLVQDMDQFYTKWFEIQQLQDENFDKERVDLEYIQESSFEIVCQALALKGDPSVLPYFLKYVPVDGRKRAHHQVVMEDCNQQNLDDCITKLKYYGNSYIPVLLMHIHELIPDKMKAADSFLYQMLLDDLRYFQDTHPLINNLCLARRGPLSQLMKYALEKTLEEIKSDHPEESDNAIKILNTPLDTVSYTDKPIKKIAFLWQEFLKLNAAD